MWAVVALLGNTILAVVGITDKFILTKTVSKPVVFVFYSTIFILGLFLLLPFGFVQFPLGWVEYLPSFISGACFFFGLWAMYTSIEKSEVSRVGPLVGAAVPFFILFLSRIFLAEKLTLYALLGAACLIFGSLLISFEKKGDVAVWHNGLGWAVISGFLFAVSHVAAKYVYDGYGFYSGFILTKLPIGVFGATLLLHPEVRAIFSHKQKLDSEKPQKKNQPLLICAGIILGVIGTTLIQFAMSLGSVSLVNALAGVQYAMLIVFVAIVSKFFPNIIKETFTKEQIIYKLIAVSVIGLGLFLLLY